jgi:hypothetical protein
MAKKTSKQSTFYVFFNILKNKLANMWEFTTKKNTHHDMVANILTKGLLINKHAYENSDIQTPGAVS